VGNIMQYKGDLYAKIAGKYIQLPYTSTDFDLLYETVKVISKGHPKAFGFMSIDLARTTINLIDKTTNNDIDIMLKEK